MRSAGRILKSKNENWVGYLFLAPWLVGFILMYVIPMISSIYFSFTNYTLLNEPKFIGLDNYKRMLFEDETFWKSLGVTFYYVFALVPLRLAFALFVAMLLNKKMKGLGIYRTLYYIPPWVYGSLGLPC